MVLLASPACNFQQKAYDFTAKLPDGENWTLSDHVKDNPFLVMFICNHCPYVQAIIERLVADAKTMQKYGIDVVAVMPNDYGFYPDDAPEKMIEFAEKHDFSFPYVVDEHQDIAKNYDAICTPDFFGFNADWELQYRGRIDDVRLEQTNRHTPELLNAMLQIKETGEGPSNQNASMGCSVKWRV
ncbi:MAG: thioredoxin family protein [Pseudomonadota bacterium]